MGAKFFLLIFGTTALLFALLDHFGSGKDAQKSLADGSAKAKDFRRRSLFIELGIAAFAFIVFGFLQLTNTDIPAVAWHQVVTIAFVVLVAMTGPGIYFYLSWRQRQFRRQRRLPDGSLSEKDAQALQRLSRFKNLLLPFVAGLALLVFYIR